jgi:DNA-binding GntR family transcriptional regulator
LAVPAAPIPVTSVVDQVYEVVRERILAGALVGGARLRQETIAAELGVSRTPLREALRRLASEGLVVLEPNRGARVCELTDNDLAAAYQARLVVEPGAARLAAGRVDHEAVARMRSAVRDHRRARSQAALFAANRAFHIALVAAAGNEHLTRFAEQLWVARVSAVIYARQHPATAEARADADEHERILDAVSAGDGDLAERRVRAHIGAAVAQLRSKPGAIPAPPSL